MRPTRKGELVQPDIGIDGADDALLRRFDISNHSRRARPQHRRSNGLHSAEAGHAHGRSCSTPKFIPAKASPAEIFYSNVKGWIQILDNIMARNLPVETYIPGHGPAHIGRGMKDLEEQKRYFVVMRDEVAKMIAAGKNSGTDRKGI